MSSEETPVNSSLKKPVTIVVLGRFNEVFKPFVESVKKYFPDTPVVFVRDGNEIEYVPGWTLVQGPEKFSMAGNGNMGVSAAEPNSDILYVGDDVRFLNADAIKDLQEVAYKDETIGILSAKIVGRGSATQVSADLEITFCRPLEMWFPCVYIKRELINKIGFLDERFNDFGCDDLDFCIRTLLAGYSLAVTNRVTIQHEASTEGGPSTFVKKIGLKTWKEQERQAQHKLCEKYKITMSDLEAFFRTGDLSIVSPKAPALSKSEEEQKVLAKEKLKHRTLYVATPAYGGMLTVNYVNSLLALVHLCKDLNIRCDISFLYNESLITRARNKMVSDYMRHPNKATDFVFIDADIGFDARDIVMMMVYDEGIIGAPCVRKNLRLDRVAEAAITATKTGKKLSINDLEQLTGEFVVNFPPSNAARKLDLSQLTEVQDVGTGIMRVKREVFEKIQNEEQFSDHWYVPMGGEADDLDTPMFMFFQSCIDPESAKNNKNGYPHYIAEDYAFCRMAASVGVKIYLAPWMITNHLGSYIFKGNLAEVAKNGGRLR